MAFTGGILAVDHYGQKAGTARLTLVTFATTALLNAAAARALGGPALASIGLVAWQSRPAPAGLGSRLSHGSEESTAG